MGPTVGLYVFVVTSVLRGVQRGAAISGSGEVQRVRAV